MGFLSSNNSDVARDKTTSFDPINIDGPKAGFITPVVKRNQTLDLKSPHQNVIMGFEKAEVSSYAGQHCFVEIDGVVNSDTEFTDAIEVVIDLKMILGATASVILFKQQSISPYTKNFIFKAFGVLLATLPKYYEFKILIRLDHKGVVDDATDILTYSISARFVFGSGIASWFVKPKPLPGQASDDQFKMGSDDSQDDWEKV